ncbi:hypothetical protein G6F59_017145 [Rhizopus arrhizus]|nr:hypothetical protein G6F59_017145 [Rhizopus arrhizus]
MRHLRADRGRHAIAHGAGAARGQPAVRFVETQVLRGPHLVLAHVGGHDGVTVGQRSIQAGHQMLRQDRVGGGRETQAILAAPRIDALEPGCQARRVHRLVAQIGTQRPHQWQDR